MLCIFHSTCSDPLHSALSILIVLCAIFLTWALLTFVGWCINCAFHTSECNSIAIDNSRKLEELSKRINSLENQSSVKQLNEIKPSDSDHSFITSKIRIKFK